MPSFLNRLGASFLPQQRRPLINQNAFGYNQQLPMPYDQGINQPPQEPDFNEQYAKITGNRPNRLAYQQGVNEGAPQISRGKWAKLGAMLAAGGAGLGGTPASQAAQLGISAYETPQRKSDEDYKLKMQGLGNLAQFEDQDVQDKIRALEFQRGEHWKAKEDKRQDSATDLAIKREQRDTNLSDAQIKHLNMQMDDLQTDKWTDPMSGISYERGPDHVIRTIGQTAKTPQQAADAAALTRKAEEAAMQPGRDKENQANYKQAMDVAGVNYDKSVDTAKVRADAHAKEVAQRLRDKASTMKPDDVMKNIYLDMAIEMDSGDLPGDAAGYLTFENGVPTASAGLTGNKQTAAIVRDFIARSIAKSRGGGNTPAAGGAGRSNINPVTGKEKTDPLGLGNKGKGGGPGR